MTALLPRATSTSWQRSGAAAPQLVQPRAADNIRPYLLEQMADGEPCGDGRPISLSAFGDQRQPVQLDHGVVGLPCTVGFKFGQDVGDRVAWCRTALPRRARQRRCGGGSGVILRPSVKPTDEHHDDDADGETRKPPAPDRRRIATTLLHSSLDGQQCRARLAGCRSQRWSPSSARHGLQRRSCRSKCRLPRPASAVSAERQAG